eukprot:TRINITY_DN26034_c0_g1_i1.p1 TRINITY_DN26034_c0_g1~~TRINITY_DN26034_c0_g1_i1.p1  ORF type:complete len:327 (-),score=38.61 TRINITY_DN26034_c0_g1_i1:434-1345(-)
MVAMLRGSSRPLFYGVQPGAMTKTLLEHPSETDIETCSTQDKSSDCGVSESSSVSFDRLAVLADDDEMITLMRRTHAEVPEVEKNAPHELGRTCSSAIALTRYIDGNLPSSKATRGEKHAEERDDDAQVLAVAPRCAGFIEDIATVDVSTNSAMKTVGIGNSSGLYSNDVFRTPSQRGSIVASNGAVHTPDVAVAADAVELLSFDEYITRSPLCILGDDDSDVASVDSGVSGPPSSRANVYDLGYSHDVRLPRTYVSVPDPLTVFFNVRGPRQRRCRQDVHGSLNSCDGAREVQRKTGVRMSL